MNILRCVDSIAPQNGGPSYSVINSSLILASRGHTVTIVTMDEPEQSYLAKTEGVRHIALGPSLGRYRFSLKYLAWLWRNLESFDFAIVHGIWQFSSYGFYLANRLRKVPYLVMPHGSLDVWDKVSRPFNFKLKSLYWNLFERKLYQNSVACLFTAKEELKTSTTLFDFSSVSYDLIAYGCLDRKVYRLHSLDSDNHIIVFLGRLHPKKGIDILIEAFSVCYKNNDAAKLLIAGIGEQEYIVSLKKLASSLGVDRKIEWRGHASGSDKDSLILSAGLFVLPSYQENFGLAVAESLSFGTPVAISRNVNIHSTVSESGAGYVFENTVPALVNVLTSWRDSQNIPADIRLRARQCFEDHMSLEAFVDEIVAISERAVNTGK